MVSGFRNLIVRFFTRDHGHDLIEYILLMVFVALAAISLFVSIGKRANTVSGSENNMISSSSDPPAR